MIFYDFSYWIGTKVEQNSMKNEIWEKNSRVFGGE